MARGVTVRDIRPADFIKAYAEHLKTKDNFEVPKWADIVKTGIHKEVAPYDADWYYTRAAAVLRQVYLKQGIGVGALRRTYGGAQDRGVRRQRTVRGAGGIIRHVLLQFESLKYVQKDDKGGRRITREGQTALDQIATALLNTEGGEEE